MNKQVGTKHYNFDKYVSLKRWDSYYYQIKESLNTKGKEILLIGKGDGIVVEILKFYGKNVTVLDFDKDLKPDIVGSVTKLDELLTKKYDVIVCCQVLEHIPFDEFENIIKQISDYTKEKFILSLPNDHYWWEFGFRVPILDRKRLLIPMRFFWRRKWDMDKYGFGEHYWEIDAEKQWKKKKIISILKKYFNLESAYIVKEHPYHMFFIMNNKKK